MSKYSKAHYHDSKRIRNTLLYTTPAIPIYPVDILEGLKRDSSSWNEFQWLVAMGIVCLRNVDIRTIRGSMQDFLLNFDPATVRVYEYKRAIDRYRFDNEDEDKDLTAYDYIHKVIKEDNNVVDLISIVNCALKVFLT